MARERLLTHKFQMMMSEAEVRQFDDWMFSKRIKSRAEAIRQLASAGLLFEPLLDAYGALAALYVSDPNSATNPDAVKNATERSGELQQKILDVALVAAQNGIEIPRLASIAGIIAKHINEKLDQE